MTKILITGGTGFLGKRLAKKLKVEGHEVVITGRNNKQLLLASNFSGCESLAMDVSNIESVRDITTQTLPEIIIHAAATKFVDISEKQPMEAIDVNVAGSQNIARVAIEKGVSGVIGISTDKASPPVRNTYGLTKALMERLFYAMDNKSNTKFMCVRYGNVAWSTGSVLCIWKKMLEETGVIGTAGPEMYRFFFTVDEAVDLVKVAFDNLEEFRGKILSKKMKAAQMSEILRVWTQYSGGKFEKIKGRPGERIEEFLFGEIELPFTKEIVLNKKSHYLISFNENVENPVESILSSTNTELLTDKEILDIVLNPPIEEI
jgi:FlaA1/EpsC-like NDP-sugar epimerase